MVEIQEALKSQRIIPSIPEDLYLYKKELIGDNFEAIQEFDTNDVSQLYNSAVTMYGSCSYGVLFLYLLYTLLAYTHTGSIYVPTLIPAVALALALILLLPNTK